MEHKAVSGVLDTPGRSEEVNHRSPNPSHAGLMGARHVRYASEVKMSQAWTNLTEDSERVWSPGRPS